MRSGATGSWAFLALLACALCACQSVPYTGRRHMMLVSSNEEKAMGEQAYRETIKKAKLSIDLDKVELLRRVGLRIARVADRPDFRWEFNLIDEDKTINAWCLPGGKVAFYSGIWPVAVDEDGIAVVMSHEIAHAIARHGAERMSTGKLADLGGTAVGVALGVGGAGGLTRELFDQAYGLGVGVGVMLPYSRKNEIEADYIGLVLMAKAGYDPRSALDFWKRMEKATGGSKGSTLTNFLRTHPTDVKRQEKIEKALPEVMRKYYKL